MCKLCTYYVKYYVRAEREKFFFVYFLVVNFKNEKYRRLNPLPPPGGFSLFTPLSINKTKIDSNIMKTVVLIFLLFYRENNRSLPPFFYRSQSIHFWRAYRLARFFFFVFNELNYAYDSCGGRVRTPKEVNVTEYLFIFVNISTYPFKFAWPCDLIWVNRNACNSLHISVPFQLIFRFENCCENKTEITAPLLSIEAKYSFRF